MTTPTKPARRYLPSAQAVIPAFSAQLQEVLKSQCNHDLDTTAKRILFPEQQTRAKHERRRDDLIKTCLPLGLSTGKDSRHQNHESVNQLQDTRKSPQVDMSNQILNIVSHSNSSTKAPFEIKRQAKVLKNDAASVDTIDTQKLLTLLKESEQEFEDLSFASSLFGDSQHSSNDSLFEPIKEKKKRESKNVLTTVSKRSSPAPLSAIAKRWTGKGDKLEEFFPSTRNRAGRPKDFVTTLKTTGPQKSKNWASASAFQPSDDPDELLCQKGERREGFAGNQMTTLLPPIAHLGQLCNDRRPQSLTTAQRRNHKRKSKRKKKTPTADDQQKDDEENHCGRQTSKRVDMLVGTAFIYNATDDLHVSSKHKRSPRSAFRKMGEQMPFSSSENRVTFTFPINKKSPDNMNRKLGRSGGRPAKIAVIEKTPGNPSLIKKNTDQLMRQVSTDKGQSVMDAADLMALEEDIRVEDQEEEAKRLGTFLCADLDRNDFTDVTIKCKDHEFKIHKEFLLAFTSYDIPIIPGEPLREHPTLDLSDLNVSDVSTVLAFLYYGELNVNIYNLLGIQAAANILGVLELPGILTEFHDKLFKPSNMVSISELAQRKKLPELYSYSWKIFVRQFYQHISSPHYLSWDVKWVVNLLSSEDIPVKSELEVFNAARSWLNHRPEERSGDVRTVLTTVRWPHMTSEDMVQCEKADPCLMSRQEAHELVADANWYKVMMKSGISWTDFNISPPRASTCGSAESPDRKLPSAKEGRKKQHHSKSNESQQSNEAFFYQTCESNEDVDGISTETSFGSLEPDDDNFSGESASNEQD